jgi:hypothetical protein
VSLFKRGRKSETPGGDPSDLDDSADLPGSSETDESVGTGKGTGTDDDADPSADPPSSGNETSSLQVFDRSDGPFDVTEVDGAQDRLDLGGLWLPTADGMELQLQVDEATGTITGAFVVMGDSGVQIQAFAAPRSEGIWTEICEEIGAGITEQGGTVDPGYGRFGRELLARVPGQTPDGKVGFQPLRFAGIDGPRWLLRAVFHGQAAVDPAAAVPLEQLVAQAVVVRGKEPMGPRELLALRLPEGAQVDEDGAGGAGERGDETAGGSGGGAAGDDLGPQERLARDEEPVGSFDDLQPFRRGPEITERR